MRTLVVLLVLGALAAAAGMTVLYTGLYDVSATDQHLRPTYRLLEIGLREAVERRGRSIDAPPLDDPALARRGLAHFRTHCVQCHGAPGVAPEPFALGLVPHPAPLSATGRDWESGEIFWVIKNGLKMTGMPAWQFRMSDDDIWAIVAFIHRLPTLSPADYRAMQVAEPPGHAEPAAGAPDPQRGKTAVQQYGCITCHAIPGVVGPTANLGPPLDRIGSRTFIAGLLPNDRENMVRWLRHPQAIDRDTAMPNLGVTERDARDMAAFLETLR